MGDKGVGGGGHQNREGTGNQIQGDELQEEAIVTGPAHIQIKSSWQMKYTSIAARCV